MTKYVGIILGEASALYCEERSDGYHVINGAWGFKKSSTTIHGHKWRIVLEDMPSMDYNDACPLITEAAKQ